MTPVTEGDQPRAVRVFVGLKVAENVANNLADLAAKLIGPHGRLVAPADIHLTLVAPWQEASVDQAAEKLRAVACGFSPFLLKFQHLGYGPIPGRPSLLWADCAATVEITALRDALMRAFGQTDARPFRPHITLAHLRDAQWTFARKHPIDIDLPFAQCVRTIELFKSALPREGGYQILTSAGLERAELDASSSAEPG